MIDFETFHQLRRQREELKLTPEQIAQELGLDVKTVRKWLAKPRYERIRPANCISLAAGYRIIWTGAKYPRSQ